jgi:putative ABC transport system substrate-binding protein
MKCSRRERENAVILRRSFVRALILGVFAASLPAHAQRAGKLWRIGVLLNLYPPDADPPQALRQGLRDLGYVEGRNLVIDWRYQPDRDRLPTLATELVGLKPNVIVADATSAVRAAMQATSTIPIVMTSSADALGARLVDNLARPGGNVTGLTMMIAEMSAKRLQLLKDVVPTVSRVAVLWDPASPFHQAMLKEIAAAAPSLGLQPIAVAVRGRDDFGDAFAEIVKGHVDAVFVSETMTPSARRQLVEFVAQRQLPTMFNNKDYVAIGGLISYAPNFSEMFRQGVAYVDKILKGAKPADLPVEQPTRFELVVNLKTAQALGLTIPPSLLLRADQIIQ